MFDIQKIDCKPGDIIIGIYDSDYYDPPTASEIAERIEKHYFPNNKFLILPDNFIKDIKILDTQPNILSVGEKLTQGEFYGNLC